MTALVYGRSIAIYPRILQIGNKMAASGGPPPTVSPFTGGGGSGPGGPPMGSNMSLYQQAPPNSSLPPGMRVREYIMYILLIKI